MKLPHWSNWFCIDFYQYLFAKADDPGWTSKWDRFLCRLQHHPDGMIFYNPGGEEPDYRCKRCGDELS
jgi:hypothetical protein